MVGLEAFLSRLGHTHQQPAPMRYPSTIHVSRVNQEAKLFPYPFRWRYQTQSIGVLQNLLRFARFIAPNTQRSGYFKQATTIQVVNGNRSVQFTGGLVELP